MKRIIAGGFLFVGGSVMYAVGTLGFADTAVQASPMQAPVYIGMIAMLLGVYLGVVGLIKKD